MPAWGGVAITILIIVGLIALALRRATAELHQLERDPFGHGRVNRGGRRS